MPKSPITVTPPPGRAQAARATEPDRHPIIFSAVAALARANGMDRKVLSYGCSAGFEPLSLADYVPDADVLGVDIHPAAIAQARINTADHPRVRIAASKPDVILRAGPFGSIFAMSVLCRWPDTKDQTSIADIWPFGEFEAHIQLLDAALAPGGILALYNTAYNFRDTDAAARYEVVEDEPVSRLAVKQRVKRFDRDGVYRASPMTDCIFIKRGTQ